MRNETESNRLFPVDQMASDLLARAELILPTRSPALAELRAALASLEDAVYDVKRELGEGEPTCQNCSRDIDEHGYCSRACRDADNFDPEGY